jgi:methenyltetrahydromethanopterin cyclohydrolase
LNRCDSSEDTIPLFFLSAVGSPRQNQRKEDGVNADNLNQRAAQLAAQAEAHARSLRILVSDFEDAQLIDFGVKAEGGLAAGLLLSRICMAGLADISIGGASPVLPGLPQVCVRTDDPLSACLLSQYAGWKVATDDYFAMGSGPMRAVAAVEPLFSEFDAKVKSDTAVGVLEAATMPTPSAMAMIRDAVGTDASLTLAVAPTGSQAGNIQVVARSVETAIHKLHELRFPVADVISGFGAAPLPPVAGSDLEGIGRTNDAILYGATVNLWVRCEDDLIQELGPRVPSCSSESHGRTFLSLFKAAGNDFYAMDKALFSPAVVIFHNLNSGRLFQFGRTESDVMRKSFGL